MFINTRTTCGSYIEWDIAQQSMWKTKSILYINMESSLKYHVTLKGKIYVSEWCV